MSKVLSLIFLFSSLSLYLSLVCIRFSASSPFINIIIIMIFSFCLLRLLFNHLVVVASFLHHHHTIFPTLNLTQVIVELRIDLASNPEPSVFPQSHSVSNTLVYELYVNPFSIILTNNLFTIPSIRAQ